MSAFPMLYVAASFVSRSAVDIGLQSTSESGYVIARRRFVKQLWQFDVTYANLGATDFTALQAFYDAQGTWGVFEWTYDGTIYNVRFAPNRYAVDNTPPAFHAVKFSLLSV